MIPPPLASTAQAPNRLVVDDEPEQRGLLAENFARHGFAVRMAKHAAQARDLLTQARWLRESHPDVAIVMLTAAGEAIDRTYVFVPRA